MIAPNTDIYLIKTPIEIDEMNQLTFSNVEEQANYFMHLDKLYLDNATYQRKDNVIRYPNVDKTFDELLKYNYVAYRNDSYSDRIFYAFIKNMRYVNDGMTEIEIETDVFQTWQFEIQYRSSFVEREHVNNDTRGIHTIPENLEIGEYTTNEAPIVMNWLGSEMCLCLAQTGSRGKLVNNQYTGLDYRFFKDIGSTQIAWGALNAYIDEVLSGNDEIIQCIFPMPLQMITNYVNWDNPIGSTDLTYGTLHVPAANNKSPFDLGTYSPEFTNSLGGNYVPRNNKLLCYPYNYLMLTNNNGSSNIYRFENFTNFNPAFQIYGALVPGLSIVNIPVNYKGVEYNYSESIIGAKMPLASWNSDLYTNWMVQNGVNEDIAKFTTYEEAKDAYNMSQIPLVGGKMVQNTMYGSMAEIYQHKVVPYGSRGNINGGDINYTLGNCNFTIYHYVIKREYAEIIDDYFSSFGYKVNAVKIPNIHTRNNWNYIKTIECNLTGEIPQEDVQKLKQMFNNGVTFWHNPATFLDYSQSNYIL